MRSRRSHQGIVDRDLSSISGRSPAPMPRSGKGLRMGRISDPETGNLVLIPMDHGMTVGPIPGLHDMKKTVEQVASGGATAVVMHKGLVRNTYRGYRDTGLIMHLSASTDLGPGADSKRIVTSVHEAVRSGADAVSVHLNIGAETEAEMLENIGSIAEDCEGYGMPLMIMAYPRGPEIRDGFDPEAVAHAARVASELGADVVKCSYTGDIDSFREVVRGAMVPVVIAGGPRMSSEEDLLEMVHASLQAGGRGVSIGRNVFQHHDVVAITNAISLMVKHGATVEEVSEIIDNGDVHHAAASARAK